LTEKSNPFVKKIVLYYLITPVISLQSGAPKLAVKFRYGDLRHFAALNGAARSLVAGRCGCGVTAAKSVMKPARCVTRSQTLAVILTIASLRAPDLPLRDNRSPAQAA
jgi:hypothetical protein